MNDFFGNIASGEPIKMEHSLGDNAYIVGAVIFVAIVAGFAIGSLLRR